MLAIEEAVEVLEYEDGNDEMDGGNEISPRSPPRLVRISARFSSLSHRALLSTRTAPN